MPVIFWDRNRTVTQDELMLLEANMGGNIPEDFREFIMRFNGGEPEPNAFFISEEIGSDAVNYFMSAVEIVEEKKSMKNRLVPNAWPIADAACGNLVCLVVGEHSGIYHWDHEWEADEGEEPTWENMHFLAPTFREFWDALQPDAPDDE